MFKPIRSDSRRQRTGSSGDRSDSLVGLILDFLFLTGIATLPLALGGTLLEVQIGYGVYFVLLFAAYLAWALVTQRKVRWPGLAIAFVGIAAWTAIRGLPITGFAAPAITRDAAVLWENLSASLYAAPGWQPLAVLHLLALAAVCTYGRDRFSSTQRQPVLAWAAVAGWLAAFFVALLQWGLEAEAILWFYEPRLRDWIIPLAGPFVNPNQAGSCFGLLTVAALIFGRQFTDLRWQLLAVVIALGGVVVLVQLDAGSAQVALLAAAITWVAGEIARRVTARNEAAVTVAVAAFLFLAVTIGAYSAPELIMEQVDPNRAFKAQMWNDTLSLIGKAPVVGFGPLSIGYLLPWVSSVDVQHTFFYAESTPLQLAVDHGVPLTLLLGAVLAASWWRWIRGADGASNREPVLQRQAGVVAAYVLVDAALGMSMQSWAIALPVVALTGVVAGRPQRFKRSRVDLPRVLLLGTSTVFFVTALVTLPNVAVSWESAKAHPRIPLYDVLNEQPIDWERFEERVAFYAETTPTDPYFVAQAARGNLLQGDEARARELQEWLEVYAPTFEGTYRLKLTLARRAGDPEQICTALREVLERYDSPSDLVAVLGESGLSPTRWMDCLAPQALLPLYEGLFRAERFPDVYVVAEAARQQGLEETRSTLALVRALRAMEMTEFAVDQAREFIRREELALAEQEAVDWSVELGALGMIHEELSFLNRMITDNPEAAALRLRRANRLLQLAERGSPVADWRAIVEEDLGVARRRLMSEDREVLLASFYTQVGRAHRLDGRMTSARLAFERALPFATDQRERALHRWMGEIAEEQGLIEDAIRHYSRSLAIPPEDDSLAERLRRLQAELDGETVPAGSGQRP